jgi:hypothetical protein
MNPYQKLFIICDSADQFFLEINDSAKQDEFIQFSILGCLLATEEILDKGRISAGIGEPYTEDKQILNQKIDKLRANIIDLLKKLSVRFDREKVIEYLQSRARGIQTAWINSF